MKRLLFILLLSSSAFGLCAPSGGSGYVNITPVPTDPWGNGGARRYYCSVPSGFPADGTGVLILALNGSTLASANIGQVMATTTSGWNYKCALLSPKCAVIGAEPLTSSRYHIERVDCGPALGTGAAQGCTIKTRELNPSGGGNTTIAQLAGACSGINSPTAVTATFVDNQTVTTTNAGTCSETSPSAFAEIGAANGSFASLMRNEPSNAVDDVGFIVQILKAEIPNLNIDKKRVFCVGWSAGAFECTNLAVNRPELFAAIGLSEGSIGTQHYRNGLNTDLETSFPTGGLPISVLAFSGTSDAVVPPNGGVRVTFYQQHFGQTLTQLAAQNKCTTIPATLITSGTQALGLTATCSGGTSIQFTTPSAPATYGFATSPPNNGIRMFGLTDTVNFPAQADCNIASIAGNLITTVTMASCAPGGGIVACSGTTPSVSIEPRPYLPTANNQASWLATGCGDSTEIQAYVLNGGGHVYYGGYSDPAVTLTLASGGSTITRNAGIWGSSGDGFVTGDIIGLSVAGGWTTNVGITCTATVTSNTVLTLASCSSALTNETPTVGAYVTDNVIDGKNASLACGATVVNQTDCYANFFYAHPRPSYWNARGLRMQNGKL